MRFLFRAIPLAAALLTLVTCYAFAQGIQPAASINLAPAWQIVSALAAPVGPILLAFIVAWVGKHVRNSVLRQALDAGLQRAAGGVYEGLAAAGKSVGNVSVKNAALASAANAIIAAFPQTVLLFGLTEPGIEEMIRKELGKLLAVDPTVSIGATPPVNASSDRLYAPPPIAQPAAASGAPVAPVAGILLAGLLGLGLAACATAPQTTVAQVAVALTAADQVALAYVDLPRCGFVGANAACSDPAMTVKIKAAAATAYQAVKTAEASGASADLSLAVSAVGALSALIPATK